MCLKNRQRVTDFQKAVYRAVMKIPLGATRSYAWVARHIGRPRSSRAVGNALHKNPYAPYVPCHRVIASDGTIGGYSRGLKRKRELLKKEGLYHRRSTIDYRLSREER
jgi:O-6-methylguanine DNA methyltransferase